MGDVIRANLLTLRPVKSALKGTARNAQMGPTHMCHSMADSVVKSVRVE